MPDPGPRFRTKLIRSNDVGLQNPGFSTYRIPLGKFYLVNPNTGVSSPMPGVTDYVDVGNPYQYVAMCKDEIHPGPPFTSGGDFLKVSAELPNPRVMGAGKYSASPTDLDNYLGATGYVRYEGGFLPSNLYYNDWNFIPTVADPHFAPDTSAYELQAYRRTKPRIEHASAYVFVRESRDIPRMLKTSAKLFHDTWKVMGGNMTGRYMLRNNATRRNAADNFLNHQFGWVPFLSDLRKFYTTYQNAAVIKGRLTSENDRFVRHKVVLDDKSTDKVFDSGTGWICYPAGYWINRLMTSGQSPTWEIRERKHTYVSAVGSYKFYRPEFDMSLPDYNSAWSRIQRELDIYGLRITPANVYKATPWSWLIDWFTEFGSNLETMTDSLVDGVAAQYLYVMRHDSTELVFNQYAPFKSGPLSMTQSMTIDAKIRKAASSPYGYGLTWNLLSPRQLAILAALKITH